MRPPTPLILIVWQVAAQIDTPTYDCFISQIEFYQYLGKAFIPPQPTIIIIGLLISREYPLLIKQYKLTNRSAHSSVTLS